MKMTATSGAGCGLIKRGDPHAYLGHFRSSGVMKKGHNDGAPPPGPSPSDPLTPGGGAGMSSSNAPASPSTGTSMFTPTRAKGAGSAAWAQKNQVAAAKRGVRQARKSGGDVAGAKSALVGEKADRKAAFGALKASNKALTKAEANPGGGRVKAAKAARKDAKSSVTSRFKGAYDAKQAARKAKKSGGGFGLGDAAGAAFGGIF